MKKQKTMTKKILLALIAVVAVAGSVAGMSAFEAHVINVTAKIENALTVPVEAINFGTVFPQEQLYESFSISLSDSFLEEDRVDDVEYMIRQKPKCGITTENGTVLVGPTGTGHIIVNPQTGEWTIDCGPAPRQLEAGESWDVLPFLCPYLSKHKDVNEEENDEEMDAFHAIGYVNQNSETDEYYWVWNNINGSLVKTTDEQDNWVIDLKVPCFGGYCAQDWAAFVAAINPDANPDDYVLPIEDEHRIFGCNLWIEVTRISLPGENGICDPEADVMQVLDRSGSVAGEMTTLKDAAHAFVAALDPQPGNVHMGQSSFATVGSLDLPLTGNRTAIDNAIDGLVSSGYTHLEDGILLATAELVGGNDRPDAESPDVMVIITDGAPNECNGTGCDPYDSAEAVADAADAAGITIYVLGVGISEANANWLKAQIATSPSHYYDVSNWEDLEAILAGLGTCP